MTQEEHNAIEKELWDKSENISKLIRTHLFSIYMMKEKLKHTPTEGIAKSYVEVIEATEQEIKNLFYNDR